MKKLTIILSLAVLAFGGDLKPKDFDAYLKSFNVEEIKNMKISSSDMLELVKTDAAVLLDIRFAQEFKAWNMPFAKNIPLNELPNRLNELPKDKLIITACPHNDRANMARVYLTMKGYNVKYLSDGLMKTTDLLRGGAAVSFIEELK
ncbi:MAG: rhodanese-like domain-containing protein [Sulfurimonas sp.]|jgi:rhodanese-related sulfurtransferase